MDPRAAPASSEALLVEPLAYERPAGADSVRAMLPLGVGMALVVVGVLTLLVTLGITAGAGRIDEVAALVAMAAVLAGLVLLGGGLWILVRALRSFA